MTDEEKIKFKKLLKAACQEILKKRISAAEFSIQHAQESANSQDKSSAGDKHEVSRAMGQIDREMNERQLAEARKELMAIENINADKIYDMFVPGAIAVCDQQQYFLSAGLGKTELHHIKVCLLSPSAPLSQVMINKKSGDKILFRENEFVITDVY